MDGILLILASWVVVALLCYFFILTYSRRAVGPVQSTTSEPESVKSFQRDVLTWLFWGLDENARNQHQKLAPIFEQFVTKSLNDSSHRLHLRQKEHRPEVHFDAVHLRDKSTIAALQSFRIHPNRTPGNHLSVSGKVAHTRAKGGPIFIKISVTEAEAQTQFGGGKVQTLNSPAIRRHSVNVHELIGDIEIRIASIAGELFVIGCFKERPVVQLELVETNDEPRKAFLEEFVQRCIRGAVMNFSLGELLYPDTGSVRASRARLSAEYRDLSFLQEIYPPGSEQNSQHDSAKFPTDDRDLSRAKADLSAYCLIQLLDVTDLRISHSGDERFVVSLELDSSASERFLSPKAHSDHYQTNRIYWNEDEANFELLIGPDSRELLIELYSEADYPEPSQTVFNTVRKRTFRGMSILGVAELRAIVQQQRGGGGLVRLQLQGRPEMGKPAQQQSAEVRGVLTLKCSLQYERPSAAPRPNQGSIAAAEYAQIKRNRSSPSNGHPQQNDEQPKSKKSSTGTLSHGSMSMKRGLPRQKQHYIYNVTDDRPAFDRNGIQTDESPQRGGSSSKMSSGGETSLTPMRPNYGEQQLIGIHKTISDTNALFQFERVEERKRSAPETPVMAQKEGACADQRKPIVDEAPEPLKEDTFDQLFNGEKTKAHPAMEIFKVPEGLQTKGPNEDTGEIERRARERDRKAHGQKQKRNFFEQIKDRLSGPVQLLRRQGKRAKSLDVYDQLEEVVSSPQSRDPSQTRHGEEGKRSTVADRQQQGRQLFIRSAASSTAASTSNLHTGPQTSTKRTFPYAESQLILEFIGPEHAGPRYYYILLEISTEPAVVKLMQSGKKLHVHNAHILVASKARGRIVCSICGKRIGGNFSNRQAYQCRDCRIVCHKNCHREIDWVCENSSFFNLAEGGHIEEVDWEEYLRHHQLREFISIGNL